MKKKLSFLAALLACVFAFAACSTRVTVALNRNWNADTAAYDGNFYEQLTYDVRFQEPETSTLNGLQYTAIAGSYKVTVEAVATHRTDENGITANNVYHLTSTQEMSGTIADSDGNTIYAFGGDSGVPADTVTMEVWFRDVSEGLIPMDSTATFYSHTPLQGGGIGIYSYTTRIVYNADASSATVTVTDLSGSITENVEGNERVAILAADNAGERTLSSLTDDYSVFDNAQLEFMGRGLAFAADSSNTVTVVSAAGGAANVNLSCSEVVNSNYTFTLDGTSLANGESGSTAISTCTVNFSLVNAGSNTGVTHTVYYANTATSGNNTYRNLPLRKESPFAYGMGTLLYVLTDATHTRPAAE